MGQVAVLGAGAWGTALAKVLADKGESVRLWSRRPDHAALINEAGENHQYLAGIPLPPTLSATGDLAEALHGAELVVLVVPTHAMRETLVLARPYLSRTAPLVNASKGIENETLMLMGDVIADVLGPEARRRTTALSGPSFAREVGRELPTNVVVAASDAAVAHRVQEQFATHRFRVYTSDDPIGVEVGGALKNVIAIGAGVCEGLGLGHNSRAALITRGLAEIARLAGKKGGDQRTLAGLAGLGDLVLTCTGELSRNRTVGMELGKGRKLDEVLSGLGHVAEGVKTARSVYHLARQLGVELPICAEAYRVLHEGKSTAQALDDLLSRPLKAEFQQ